MNDTSYSTTTTTRTGYTTVGRRRHGFHVSISLEASERAELTEAQCDAMRYRVEAFLQEINQQVVALDHLEVDVKIDITDTTRVETEPVL